MNISCLQLTALCVCVHSDKYTHFPSTKLSKDDDYDYDDDDDYYYYCLSSAMRDTGLILLRLWRYVSHLLTYLLT